MSKPAALRPKPFLFAAALLSSFMLSGVIGWMIESRAQILRNGHEAVLKTQPIDPRDLLRGRYVRLNYAIQQPAPDVVLKFFETLPEERFYNDQEVFVSLGRGDEGFDEVTEIWLAGATRGKSSLINMRATASFTPNANGAMRLDYGIGRFYTNEKLAPELEKRMREGETTTVIVAVDHFGNAQIKAFQ
ncbi:MAG: GDYXXLXY domain-containing protein, partial [Pseudomonadota bacterium]